MRFTFWYMPLHNKLNYDIIFSVTLSSVITFALLCSLAWLARTLVVFLTHCACCNAVTVLSQASRML
jgi:hypothetical protein